MTKLVITPRHLPVIWHYTSNRDTASQSHRFLKATLDLAVNPGEILGLLSKCNVVGVTQLRLEKSTNPTTSPDFMECAVADVCKKFPSATELEITSMVGNLQGTVLSSFVTRLVHLTLHVAFEPLATVVDLSFEVLETLVIVDRRMASSSLTFLPSGFQFFSRVASLILAPHLQELCLVGNLRQHLLPVRALIRKFSSSITKLGLLEDDTPDNYSHLQLPPLPRLRTLIVECSWAHAAVHRIGVLPQTLPLLEQVVLQADINFIYAGMTAIHWDTFFDGMHALENRVEVIQLEIRGESRGIEGSFQSVFMDRVSEHHAQSKISSFRIEEGFALSFPEPAEVAKSNSWDNLRGGSPGWRSR
ncbi:hypothetical protein AAF712_006043 [Marasmius tenuissimus]|uniref:Uncharacterized protein n=1 Tax=Marasmius tenuissimus TaxID=585030 RepID=A0ABR2ZZP5_9AGAR